MRDRDINDMINKSSDKKVFYEVVQQTVLHATHPFPVVQVFEAHQKLGISLPLTVGLVCKALKFNISQFVADAGYGKNYMNKTLNGRHRPSKEFRELVAQRLGVDPWLYLSQTETVVIRRDVVSATPSDGPSPAN